MGFKLYEDVMSRTATGLVILTILEKEGRKCKGALGGSRGGGGREAKPDYH